MREPTGEVAKYTCENVKYRDATGEVYSGTFLEEKPDHEATARNKSQQARSVGVDGECNLLRPIIKLMMR